MSAGVGEAAASGETWSDTDAVAGGSAYLFAAQVIGNTGFFVAVLVLARALEPAGRGTVAFVIVTAMVTARIAGIGVREATMVYAARHPAQRATLLSNLVGSAAATGAVAAGLVCGALVLLAGVRPVGIGRDELVALALGIAAAAQVDAGYFFLTGCSRFRLQALVTATSSWLYAGILIVLWATVGLTIGRAVWAWVGGTAFRGAFLVIGAAHGTRFGRPDVALLRETVAFGAPAWVGSVARFMNFRTDQILMGFLATEAALGVYAVAVNASEILLYLPEATAIALVPVIARSEGAGRTEQALHAFRILMVITLLSVVVAVAVGWPLLPLVFGQKFASATGPFLLLLPGAFGYVAMSVFSNTLLATAPGLSSVGPGASLIVGLALDVVLIPPYGASGAAVAATSAFIAGGTAAVIAYRRRLPFAYAELVPHASDLAALRDLVSRRFQRVFAQSGGVVDSGVAPSAASVVLKKYK
jgi:O-antigen/teichoic acid export membrane protein